MDPSFDAWEVVLYMMGLAYTIEGEGLRGSRSLLQLKLIVFAFTHFSRSP